MDKNNYSLGNYDFCKVSFSACQEDPHVPVVTTMSKRNQMTMSSHLNT